MYEEAAREVLGEARKAVTEAVAQPTGGGGAATAAAAGGAGEMADVAQKAVADAAAQPAARRRVGRPGSLPRTTRSGCRTRSTCGSSSCWARSSGLRR